ncbi:MAG: helix-turn-helix domain-containing protein [Candidatus Latescibacterota bacterium]
MSPSDLPIELQRIGYREQGTGYHYPEHRLEGYQWYCVLYGGVDMVVEGEHHLLGPEESILIPPGARRSPRSADRAPGYLWAHFANRRLGVGGMANRVVATPLELQPDLHALVSEVQHPGDSNADDLISALLVQILIGLQRQVREQARRDREPHPDVSPVHASYQRQVVERVETFMRNNLSRPLSRLDLAHVANLSGPHLARLFRRVAHKTPGQRLAELRVDYAKRLLLESTLSITQIGLSVGYRSFSHFSSVFRQHVGIRPSDYRQSGGRTWRKSF